MVKSRCRECGAPLYTRIFRQWNDDGTVTGRFSKGIRICHIETGEICGLVDGISARIGYPIDRIVVEGDRKASRSITNETLAAGHGLLGLLGRSWGGSPVSLNLSLDISRTVGQGAPEVREHRRGRALEVEVENPFCVPIVVGDVWGMFEALHGVTAEADWEEKDNAVAISLNKVAEGMIEDDPDRLALKKTATLPGDVEFDRCPRCGIPGEVTSVINWDLDGGIVTNKVTGRREVTIMVEAVNAVIRELVNELGEEIPAMIQEIEQAYAAESLADTSLPNTEKEYNMLLQELGVMGMGNPVEISKSGDVLKVRIDNPFCAPILAGRVGGYYQALEGVAPKVGWTSDDGGFTEIEAAPA